MSGFSAGWLALRESYDVRARSRVVLEAVVKAFADQSLINIADLACGTGSTLRALGPHLAPRQNWRLFDNDLSLLARAATAPNATAVPLDLALDLEAALDGPVDLVTTSALLDLVSEDWLARLTVEAAARRIPVYAALSYDGRIEFEPGHDLDKKIVTAVNVHQRRDKGFGQALGPKAAAVVIERFERVGYSVVHGMADWVFGTADKEIQTEILSGWAAAVREIGDLSLPDVMNWLTQRRDWVTAGRSSIRVGHVDVFARPAVKR